jgi:hypothetical protein
MGYRLGKLNLSGKGVIFEMVDRAMLRLGDEELKELKDVVRGEVDRRLQELDDLVVRQYSVTGMAHTVEASTEVKAKVLEFARSPLMDIEQRLRALEAPQVEEAEEPAASEPE